MHHYIKNGRPFQSNDPIFFYEWVYGAGHVTFGMHGTELEYAQHCDCDAWPDRKLVRKEAVPETIPPLS